ncbi:MAG: hypothetical protein GXO75_15330 [Calditrichaeota bacterium]|nr:hypothetical protein [Calditrichota bacterium]
MKILSQNQTGGIRIYDSDAARRRGIAALQRLGYNFFSTWQEGSEFGLVYCLKAALRGSVIVLKNQKPERKST